MTAWIRRVRPLVAVTFIAAEAACHGDSVVSPPQTASKSTVVVEAVTALQVEGTVAHAIAQTPTVIVKDLLGKPAAGITVNFSDPTGTVSVPSVVTDQTGIASAGQWIPSDRAGQSALFVRIDGEIRIRFTALVHPDIPAFLRARSDTDNVQLAGRSITDVAAVVQDKWGNGIPGVGIAFSLSGPGVLSRPSVVTDATGFASLAAWTPGPAVGVYGLMARVDGLDSVMFKTRTLDSAGLRWYRLESMIVGAKRLATTDEYVDEAELALSPDGYYIEDVDWSYPAGASHTGGRYTLPPFSTAIKLSKSGETGAIAGDSLLIERPDPDFNILITWLYRMRKY